MAQPPQPPPTTPKIEELRAKVKADAKSRHFYPLAEELRKIGRLEESEEVLLTGLASNPSYLSAWVGLGRVLKEMGKNGGAVNALNKALTIDPENIVAARILAETYLALGQKVEAIKKFKFVHALMPADEEVEAQIDRLDREINPQKYAPVVPEVISPPQPPQPDIGMSGRPEAESPFAAATSPEPPQEEHASSVMSSAPAQSFQESDQPRVEEPEESLFAPMSQEGLRDVSIAPVFSGDSVKEAVEVDGLSGYSVMTPGASGRDEPFAEESESVWEEEPESASLLSESASPPGPLEPAPVWETLPTVNLPMAEASFQQAADPGTTEVWPLAKPAQAQSEMQSLWLDEPEATDEPVEIVSAAEPPPAAPAAPPARAPQEDPVATMTMGDLYARQGHFDSARGIYEKILERDPGNRDVREKLARLSSGDGEDLASRRQEVVQRLEQWLTKVGRREGSHV